MPTASKKQMKDRRLTRRVANRYKTSLLTVQQVAEEFGINIVTARAMIRVHISDADFKKYAHYRYHESKLAEKNPQYGNSWASDCEDGRGYLTRLVDGKRYFVHRIVMAEALGLTIQELPESMTVHHIDEDPKNNNLDNLSLTTKAGHRKIHERYQTPSEDMVLKRLSLREAVEFMTSPLRGMKAT